jgi:hypothetical protein
MFSQVIIGLLLIKLDFIIIKTNWLYSKIRSYVKNK